MKQRIPEEMIEEVRNKNDIVDVISDHVQLKKQGRHYLGLCPFHGENTPSFSVSPERQLYHCFGCGAGGNVITFVMEMEGADFIQAVEKLAERVEMALPEYVKGVSGNESGKKHENKILGHELAAKFYHHLLTTTEQGKAAYDYLLDRGFTHDMISAFQIGYAPDNPAALKALLEKRGFEESEMEEAGLLLRKESSWKYMDRFRNRVMFPIMNNQGRVIAFGGRALQEGQPKYLNSPETPIFHKNETLYALHKARPAIRKENKAILFEGYADVISAWNAGVNNGVATLGTALSARQAKIIRRNAEQAIICYDGDKAGQEAALRSAELLEQEGCQVQVALLPEGSDPDDFIKNHGKDKFVNEIIKAPFTLMSFKMQKLKKEKNLQHEGDRLQYIEEIVGEISKISKAVERDHYLRQVADEFDLSLEALKQEQYRLFRANKQQNKNSGTSHSSDSSKRRASQYMTEQRLRPAFLNAERILLAHMLSSKEITDQVADEVGGEFNVENHIALAAHLYAFYGAGNDGNSSDFIHSLTDESLMKLAAELSMLDINRNLTENELADYIKQIKNYPKWVEIEEKEKEMKEAERRHDLQHALQLANELVEMKKALKSK
ncbi:DNA primase [Bacillus sp. FJAT-44742]|uniref:DNA primase n=1 Tax=Bacillus sp. FJAT-44742 TaxID=2014005 RepID=UPI000C240A44|nr:DNA primase [Bacillus sp. FJAT-44742]